MTLQQAEKLATDFDALYAQRDDPWHIENRWYERRKREVVLACLPFETADLIVEAGCGTGVLSQLLAPRCARLLVCDISAQAIELARQRLVKVDNVYLSCQKVPEQWPAVAPQSVDCVVLSEIGYYLTPAALPVLIAQIAACLKPSGSLVACHWRDSFAERTLPTSVLHETLASGLGLQSLVHHLERDFLLDIWSKDGRSVAMHEGFA